MECVRVEGCYSQHHFLTAKPDIDKVLRSFDNVISYHNVASSEDQDIRDGLVYSIYLELRLSIIINMQGRGSFTIYLSCEIDE